jgi:hypothetical protein
MTLDKEKGFQTTAFISLSVLTITGGGILQKLWKEESMVNSLNMPGKEGN